MAQQITCTFSDTIKTAIDAAAAQRNLAPKDLIGRLTEDYLAANKFLDATTESDIKLSRELLDEAVAKALHIRETEGFSRDITYKTISQLCEDTHWIEKYTQLVKANPYKHGNREKVTINQNLGYYIKRALGAQSEMKNGRPVNEKVTGSIIQSYTPLAE